MQETAARPMPAAEQTHMLTSWSTTRPELKAGRFMRAFVRVNVYLYTRPPSKAKQSINRFFIRLNVWLYRRSQGRIFGRFGDLDALLLTTTGRRTGKARTTPVGYMYEGGRFVVCAVPGHFDVPGGPKAVQPAWFLNLRANPQAAIDIGKEQIEVTAEVLPPGAERDKYWERITGVYPFIGEFQKRANHLLPMVVLTPNDLNPKDLNPN
jgi:deazaflavin-dependent oxidoreductase (nitroreductase family)